MTDKIRLVRASIYESDPLDIYVRRVADDDQWTDHYELPEELLAQFEAAEAAIDQARAAIRAYIADNKLQRTYA